MKTAAGLLLMALIGVNLFDHSIDMRIILVAYTVLFLTVIDTRPSGTPY